MIPIGSRVRWRDGIARTSWVGVVTAHITDKMVECDGKGGISAGLLEVIEVGEMEHDTYDEEAALIDGLVAERDALAELVATQCEMLAAVPNNKEVERLREVEADFIRLRDAVNAHFFNLFGTFSPTSMDCRAVGVDASDLIAELARH